MPVETVITTMPTVALTPEGAVVLPASVRKALGWKAGDRVVVEARPDGVYLHPAESASLDEVAGMLSPVPSRSIEEQDEAVANSMRERWRSGKAR